MKKILSIAWFLCVLGSTANAMQARLQKDDEKQLNIRTPQQIQRFAIQQERKAKTKNNDLTRSQERDKKYKDPREDHKG